MKMEKIMLEDYIILCIENKCTGISGIDHLYSDCWSCRRYAVT